jgi:hypothetical protein
MLQLVHLLVILCYSYLMVVSNTMPQLVHLLVILFYGLVSFVSNTIL